MTYPGALTFPGPSTFPGADPDLIVNVRVEVAFTTGLDDPAPAFVDVSSWVVGNAGIQIVRGRLDEYATVSPGTCTLTFDNTDGRFTAGYAGSPWFPNVKIRKKLRVTYRDPAGPIFYRFTGYVEEWPTAWPAGKDYSEAQVTAVDRFKRLGDRAPFKSVIEEENLSDNPYAYYTLGEPALSTLAGDTSKNGRDPLTVAQLGSGGTLTFGSGVGPPTDSLTAAVLAPANTTNGKYLTVTLPTSSLSTTGQGLDVFFLTSVAALQTIATLAGNASGAALLLQVDATGKLTASSPLNPLLAAVTSAGSVADGATHHAAATLAYAGPNVTLTLILDGTTVGTSTVAATVSQFSVLTVGGGSGTVFAGTISHAACYDTAPAVARFTDHRLAGVTGFSGERSDQRIGRYARWAGIPTAEQVLDTGLSTSICAVDPTGQAPLQAMQDMAATESGILAVNGAGQLTFQSRGHRYNTASVLTLAGEPDLDPSTQFISNDAYLINDITATRPGGITFRSVNAQSVTDYGTATPTTNPLTLLTTSDNEVVDAANWRANQTADPAPRLPNLTVDILNRPAIAGQLLALDVSSRITAGTLPAQAPAASVDLFVEGWTENITPARWPIAFNTSPAPQSGVWQLDSSLYSQLGTSTRLAY